MKDKKLVIIIGIVVVAIIAIVVGYIFIKKSPETGSFNHSNYTSNGYNIEINSTEPGHPSGKSHFNTSFSIKDNEGNSMGYDVDFLDVELFSNNTDNVIYDIARPEEININNKKFEYYLSSFESGLIKATLNYRLPDGKGNLVIEVTGRNVFNARGETISESAIVDREILQSKELAGILNFNVKK